MMERAVVLNLRSLNILAYCSDKHSLATNAAPYTDMIRFSWGRVSFLIPLPLPVEETVLGLCVFKELTLDRQLCCTLISKNNSEQKI